jgi:two-component system CheB/CheR fusion protein
VLAGEFAYLEVELDATNRRGKTICCRVTYTPLLDAQREIQGVIMLIEEEKEAL